MLYKALLMLCGGIKAYMFSAYQGGERSLCSLLTKGCVVLHTGNIFQLIISGQNYNLTPSSIESPFTVT